MDRNKLIKAINLWNKASNPAKCRSDHGHQAARKAANKAKRFLQRNFIEGRDYVEFSNGSYFTNL